MDSNRSKCESEPEVILYDAIDRNANGLLKTYSASKIDVLIVSPQVKLANYRVDFLLNFWLIVEVDGRRYHSNETSFYRDRDRDSFFSRNGFIVQRYSAKEIYRNSDAVARTIIKTVLEMHDGPKVIKQMAIKMLLNGEDPRELLEKYPMVELNLSDYG